MKTAMGMEKAKVWISENLGTKIATRLFRGLALGALLVAATGIYFSINQGEAGSPLASERFEEWPEAGFDSYTYHRFMVEQGKVSRVLSGAVANPSAIDLNEVWSEIEDTPVYHLMKQLKAGTPSSFDPNEVWSEIEDTPVYHLMKQLKAGS